MDDNLNYDEIDFTKQKRGKHKNKPFTKRWSLFVIEGIIVLVAVVAGGRFLFADNTEVSHLQATIDAQNEQIIGTASSSGFLESGEQTDLSGSQGTAHTLFNRAMQQIADGAIYDAINTLDVALELDTSYAEAYFERGELHYELSQYYQASKDYSLAVEYNYEDKALAYLQGGKASFFRDDYSSALGQMEKVVELDPDDADGYYWRGRSHVELGDYQDGIDDILQAVEMGYDELAFSYFFVAKAYDALEQYDSALKYYTLSISHSSDDCETYACWVDYNNRGTTHYWMGDYEAAIEDYTTSIQVNPEEYPLALKNRGDAYSALGEQTLALSDWNTVFQLIEGDVVQRAFTEESHILRDDIDEYETQVHVDFEGHAGETVTLTLTVADDSYLNAMLILRDANGSPLAYAAPANDPNARLTDIQLLENGTYTVVVASNLGNSSGEFILQLE